MGPKHLNKHLDNKAGDKHIEDKAGALQVLFSKVVNNSYFYFYICIIIIIAIHCNFSKLFAVCNFGHFVLILFLCCMFVLEIKDEWKYETKWT